MNFSGSWLIEAASSTGSRSHVHTQMHVHMHTDTCMPGHQIIFTTKPLQNLPCYFWILIKNQLLILPLAWKDILVLISVLYSFTIKEVTSTQAGVCCDGLSCCCQQQRWRRRPRLVLLPGSSAVRMHSEPEVIPSNSDAERLQNKIMRQI